MNQQRRGGSKRRGKGGRRRLQTNKASSPCTAVDENSESSCNFVPEAGPGCYIARREVTNSWLLEWEDIDPNDYDNMEDTDNLPEIAIDPEEFTLSLCNFDPNVIKVAYITVFLDKGLVALMGRDGTFLRGADSTDNQGTTRSCVTLIVLCPPLVFCHLCHLVPSSSGNDMQEPFHIMDVVDIESDVQEWNRHGNINDTHSQKVAFPLLCCSSEEEYHPTSYLCSQGEGGHLTHFFAGNQHAIDFACPIGTPLVAVGDGEVVDVQDHNTLSGIAVSNLFLWNSIMLRLDSSPKHHCNDMITDSNSSQQERLEDPIFVEYVHIEHKSAKVQVGERVSKGQVIACSGSIGFSPEPHLHFCAYRSREASAPTVRVYLESADGEAFLPKAGIWYNANGPVTKS